jgi:hypothetical protein
LGRLGCILVARESLVSDDGTERLAPDLAAAVSLAGVDATLDGRDLEHALRRAIASRRGYCDWTVDHAGWVVVLMSPEEHEFHGKSLEEALAWCLVWLMAPELGVGPFVVPTRQADTTPALMPVSQPFTIGDRVIVVANEHYERETLNLVGCTGKVREVYPYPIDYIEDVGVLIDGERDPRLFPPSALARLDPEADL